MVAPLIAVLVAGAGFGVFSILPIWRSGAKRDLNFWDFMRNHTIYGDLPMFEKHWDDEEGHHTYIIAKRPEKLSCVLLYDDIELK